MDQVVKFDEARAQVVTMLDKIQACFSKKDPFKAFIMDQIDPDELTLALGSMKITKEQREFARSLSPPIYLLMMCKLFWARCDGPEEIKRWNQQRYEMLMTRWMDHFLKDALEKAVQ